MNNRMMRDEEISNIRSQLLDIVQHSLMNGGVLNECQEQIRCGGDDCMEGTW
jgi:hypothetical protein